MRNRNTIWLLREKTLRTIHFFALMSMLHSTIAAPVQRMVEIFDLKYGYYEFENIIAKPETVNATGALNFMDPKSIDGETLKKSNADGMTKKLVPETDANLSTKMIYLSDINEGTIGATKETPYDNGSDNIFK